MGYHTSFKGVLNFTKELKASELARLNSILGEDCRDHPEWEVNGLYYIDLKLTDDFSGIEWDGAEKTYDMEKLVNVVLKEMQNGFPDFMLKGTLFAQGEDAKDRWECVIRDGKAIRVDTPPKGTKIECPSCGEYFFLE